MYISHGAFGARFMEQCIKLEVLTDTSNAKVR